MPRTMAGINAGGVGKGKKPGPDRLYQRLVRPPGEIGSPYTVGEQRVTGDDQPFPGQIETAATRCMTGCMEHLYLTIAERNNHLLFQKTVRRG